MYNLLLVHRCLVVHLGMIVWENKLEKYNTPIDFVVVTLLKLHNLEVYEKTEIENFTILKLTLLFA